MLSLRWIKYRWRLNKLFSEQDTIGRSCTRLVEEARKQGKRGEEIERIRGEAGAEHSEIQREIDMLTTSYLAETARKYMLPTPEYGNKEMWEEQPYPRSLTKRGVAELRSAIRKERKERRESFLPWICALVGLVGAVTGLLSVILR